MRKMKWAALLAMLLTAVLPCAALAAPGDVNFARGNEMNEKYEDSIYGGCVAGDALYLYGYNHFFVYHIGDAELTVVEFELPETEGPEEGRDIRKLFSDGENLYALLTLYSYAEDDYGVRGAQIYAVEVGEDAVTFRDPIEIDIDDLTVSYGGDEAYFAQVNAVCCVGGDLMMYVYMDDGEEALYALDLETGEGDFVEDVERIRCITAYKDDQLLIQSYNYEDGTYEFSLYDPQSGSMTSACDPIDREFSIDSIVYSEESGRLFYLSEGYVKAAEDFDFENAQPVAELSNLYYSEDGGMLLPGDYYVHVSYEGTSIRATDPNALPETRLVVCGGGYSEATMGAYYSFGNTHGDVAVILNQDYYNSSELIEAMMSRDSSVDIYMLSVESEAYDALYNRGYMVELDNAEILSAVEEMYPAIQDVLKRDGDVVAVPVSLYGWMTGLDYEGFEKLGIDREDVPDNWPELLDLLEELPDMLPEDGSVRIFEEYYTQRDVRNNLIRNIMECWRIHQLAMGREISYDEPELVAMFEQVMNLDYEAMNLREDDEDEEMYWFSESSGPDRIYTLIEMSVGCTIGNFYSNCEPTVLSAVSGEPGEVPLELSVAFVNPFSAHVELAQEFLAELMNNMGNSVAYNLSDKLNEPVRYAYSLQVIEEYGETLEKLRGELETADPVDVPGLEEEIASCEEILDDMERYGWDIGPTDIEWYRAHEDEIFVTRFNFLYADDNYSEIYDLSEQFLDGRVSAADFLREVDRKVRMRALEGN